MNGQGTPTRPTELGLMFTHRCPIECRHCGILSGPKNMTSMDDDVAADCIAQAAALDPRPATIVFTGGEPLMYPARLERLLELCYQLGLCSRVVTSGFWGRNLQTGRRLIHRMRYAGLDALNFSADKFHLEFLEPRVFHNAIEIAWEVGLPVIVNMTVSSEADPIMEFSRLYAIASDRVGLFDESEFFEAMRRGDTPADFMSKINLSIGRLVGLGRAAQYPEELRLDSLSAFSLSPCSEVVNRPVVYPDGTLQACCCAGGKLATFYVGNVNERPLAELFNVMRGRTHFEFINRCGPRALFEAMADMQPDQADLPERFASICDVCVAATSKHSPGQVDSLLEHWGLKRLLQQSAALE